MPRFIGSLILQAPTATGFPKLQSGFAHAVMPLRFATLFRCTCRQRETTRNHWRLLGGDRPAWCPLDSTGAMPADFLCSDLPLIWLGLSWDWPFTKSSQHTWIRDQKRNQVSFMLHRNSDMAWLRSCSQWCAPPMAATAELKLTTSARRVSCELRRLCTIRF